MGLDLNDSVQLYKDIQAAGTRAIPELVGEGRELLSVAGLAGRRINSQKNDWRNSYFFTGDAFVYSPDAKKFKVVLGSDHISGVTRDTTLINGAIPLGDGEYSGLKGEEFVVSKLAKHLGRDMSLTELRENPIWATFVQDKALCNEYFDRMVAEMKDSFGYDKTMGVYVADQTSKHGLVRPAVVAWLELWSQLSGGCRVDYFDARWVGVAPEAQMKN